MQLKWIIMLTTVNLWWFSQKTEALNVTFYPPSVNKLVEEHKTEVQIVLNNYIYAKGNCLSYIDAEPDPCDIVSAQVNCSSLICEEKEDSCNVTLLLEGKFLGLAQIYIRENGTSGSGMNRILPSLPVKVVRQQKMINRIFGVLVIVIVSLNYINMGCALDMEVVKAVLKKPVGPAVGFACQVVIMPLVSYGVGQLLFADPILRLGLFTFGSSPGGGASNMWTVLLRGNLNLSITMTFISSITALGTIPLWLFTLGKTIVQDTDIHIPYVKIVAFLFTMVVPIGIGLLIQRYFPRVAAIAKRILAPVCIIILIVLVVLGTVSNLFMFRLLKWRMVIAASVNVWFGFLSGALAALAVRFTAADIIAVAVETGIQNSGVTFLILTNSLDPPVSDIASVVPVAASIVTPIPLLIIFLGQRLRDSCCRRKGRDPEVFEEIHDKVLHSKDNDCIKGIDNPAH